MRKLMLILLSFLLSMSLWACGHAEEVNEEKTQDPPLTVTVEPVPQVQETPVQEEEEPEMPDHPAYGVLPQGGVVAPCGTQAAIVSQQGGIMLADLTSAGYRFLSGDSAAKVYFDGEKVFYANDDGIYALDADGQRNQLSDHLSYALWIEGGKIYYIRQTDLSSEQPVGELWCMDTDGSSAVIILASRIRGNFCIKDSWVYYISAEDGALYRSMLFGSQVTKLADGGAELCFVTDRGVYYKEQGGRQMLWRIDLRTGANIALGAYGEIVEAGDTIAIMARREQNNGSLENLFTLMVFDEQAGELNELMHFENIGTDSLAWLQGEYVYLTREDGSVYRMMLTDAEQTKETLFEGDIVFADGRAWHIGAGALEVYDCATLETIAIKLG
ncbi:MAG: DUF5050 domain-containing protein [Clostridia bacterium]|nr:DUF5050 domain-containing protein [Clostridia bacterium]